MLAALLLPLSAVSQAIRETIPEVGNRLASGDRIERDYMRPLGLEGRSAAFALDTLLAEGFRCGIVLAGEYAPGSLPMWHCVKQPSGYAPPCDELSVPVRFAEPVPWTTRDALLLHLADIRVRFASVYCAPPRVVSAAYLAAREVAERDLQSYVRSLGLSSEGHKAHKALLLAGFECGFARPPGDKASSPEMVCTRLPSQIKFCTEAKVVLSLAWPAGVEASNQLLSALPRSRVKETRSSCEVPATGGDGEGVAS